ncbi:MAG: ATP-binding protein [Muribaculaceae bacterium]|nr:ATP-binding protein [Muribaculaceae bacterium]
MEYLPRIADKILQDKLSYRGAVLIEGPKWCGKTSTGRLHSQSELDLSDPQTLKEASMMAGIDGKALLIGETPRLIDEWQDIPVLWDLIRSTVDRRSEFGQFILTGSAVPPNMDEVHHTGTGRIGRMVMRTMSLWESRESTGEISLSALFDGKTGMTGHNKFDIDRICYVIARGGWPMAINLPPKGALMQAIDYYNAVVNFDVARIRKKRLSPEFAKRLLRVYSRHIGYQTPLSTIQKDMADGGSMPDIETVGSYITSFKDIFMIEEMPAWNTNLRSKTAVRSSPTRYFTDPSIACAAMGVGMGNLKNDLKALGMLFENLCVRDLRIYAQAIDGNVYHYRDSAGLECDCVVSLHDGRYALIEVKLGGESNINEGISSLNKLEAKIDYNLMPRPTFKMVLTAVGSYAYQNAEGIWIVPIATLKD